jgi:hypothetical protein
MDQPSVVISGLRVDEPVTALTDVLVSLVCFYAFVRITSWKNNDSIFFFLRWYFLTMGLATLWGGVFGHAFLYRFTFAWKLPGWAVSMLSVTLIERVSIEMCERYVTRRFVTILRIINISELAVFMFVVFYTLNFRYVEVHSTYGLLIVVGSLQIYHYRKTASYASLLMISAITVLLVAAVVFMTKTSMGPWFNHADISHVLMTLAAFLFYRAAVLLRNTREEVGRHSFGAKLLFGNRFSGSTDR